MDMGIKRLVLTKRSERTFFILHVNNWSYFAGIAEKKSVPICKSDFSSIHRIPPFFENSAAATACDFRIGEIKKNVKQKKKRTQAEGGDQTWKQICVKS